MDATRRGRILVAGGGIAGLALGIALRHRGLDAVVLERSAEPERAAAGWCWPPQRRQGAGRDRARSRPSRPGGGPPRGRPRFGPAPQRVPRPSRAGARVGVVRRVRGPLGHALGHRPARRPAPAAPRRGSGGRGGTRRGPRRHPLPPR
ncbi:FAD-binding protein [Nonomuraea ferruginea]